ADAVHLDDLVPHARDVAVRTAHAAADPFDEDLVVLIDEVDCSIADGEGRHLPAVLDELDLHALAERRVRLLRLDRDLLEDNPLPLRNSTSRSSDSFGIPSRSCRATTAPSTSRRKTALPFGSLFARITPATSPNSMRGLPRSARRIGTLRGTNPASDTTNRRSMMTSSAA